MQRVFVLFFLLAIMLTIDLYAFQGFKHLIRNLSQPTHRILVLTYWVLVAVCLGITLRFFIGFPDSASSQLIRFLFTAVFILFIAKFLWSVLLIVDDLTRAVIWIGNRIQQRDIDGVGRRDFLVRSGALLGAGLGAALTYGVTVGSHHYKVHRRKIGIPNLSPELNGLKIVQISDIHTGSFWNHKAVERGVELIRDQQADLVVFTGDIVNNQSSELDAYEDLFAKIDAPLGVYAIMGNHDYADYMPGWTAEQKRSDIERLHAAYRRMNWRLLLDEHVKLEHNGSSFNVIGVQNWSHKGNFPRYGDLGKAMDGVEKEQFNLLLSHDPTHWKGEVLPSFPEVDLTLSGHTHGMQFGVETANFKWSPVQYIYEQWAGLYRDQDQQLYVNRGFGYLGYPGRLGIRPEIAVLELETA